MTLSPGFGPERFDAVALQLNARVHAVTPLATFDVIHGPDSYCCASWRLNNCGARELFVEQPGSKISPFTLRLGVYFQDAETVTAGSDGKAAALQALITHRSVLQALGARCTFTPGSGTRDDRVFGWSEQDLTEWLTSASENRDLVWLWDFRKGEPDPQQLEAVLAALHPIWISWNALARLKEED